MVVEFLWVDYGFDGVDVCWCVDVLFYWVVCVGVEVGLEMLWCLVEFVGVKVVGVGWVVCVGGVVY